MLRSVLFLTWLVLPQGYSNVGLSPSSNEMPALIKFLLNREAMNLADSVIKHEFVEESKLKSKLTL